MKICPVCSREFTPGLTHCPDDGVALVALNTGATTRPEDLIGQVVEGRYKIERIVGKGGMGTVYACRHIVVGKVAAMKVLRPGVERSDGVLQRFVREAQTANLLKSRHIVEINDFGQLGNGLFYVVMELLEGEDLTRAMKPGKLTRPELVHIFTQMAETLGLAHDKGIVHRDLKPDNVFLVNEGGDRLFVKLLDFGIAKVMHGESSAGLTETGVILGTPYYMSPEQARAEQVDHRTDIYALGVMMYRAFTGRLPFVADSTMGVLTRHLTEAPELPSRISDIDPAVERLILRCMEKKRDVRIQSMFEVAAALRALPLGPSNPIREEATRNDLRSGGIAAEPSYSGPLAMSQPIAAQSGAVRPSWGGGAPAPSPSQPGGPQAMWHATSSQPGAGHTPSHPGAWAAQSAPPAPTPSHPGMSQPGMSHPGMNQQAAWHAQSSQRGPAVAHPGWPGTSSQPGGVPAITEPPQESSQTALRWPPGTTAQGFVTSSHQPPTASRKGLLIAAGAIVMLAAGAAFAAILYRGHPAPTASPAAAVSPSTTVAAAGEGTAIPTVAPSVAVAPPVVVPSVAAAPVATAAVPAATASASAAAPAAVAAVKPKGGGGPVPKPSVAPTATPRHGEIRSPFD